MSQYNYIVTASKPTVVTHALQCSFTGADDRNLILVYVPPSSRHIRALVLPCAIVYANVVSSPVYLVQQE